MACNMNVRKDLIELYSASFYRCRTNSDRSTCFPRKTPERTDLGGCATDSNRLKRFALSRDLTVSSGPSLVTYIFVGDAALKRVSCGTHTRGSQRSVARRGARAARSATRHERLRRAV